MPNKTITSDLSKSCLSWAAWFLAAVALRVMTGLTGFPCLIAMALFATQFFGKNFKAYLGMMAVLFCGDWLLNLAETGHFSLFYPGFYWQYFSCALMVFVGGQLLGSLRFVSTLGVAFLGSVLFFILSNFGVWFEGLLYPKTAAGLWQCYVMALPFFKTLVFATAIYAQIIWALLHTTRQQTVVRN